MEITCPSGLRGRIRKYKGRDQGAIFRPGRGRGKRTDGLDPLLAGCWEETLDPGIYRFDGQPDWGEVLLGDRTKTLLMARAVTHGSDYSFMAKCGDCKARFPWTLDLNDLETQPLPDESKEKLLAKQPFEVELPDGTSVKFHLQRGKDQARIPADVDVITGSILSRLDAIGDVGNQKKFREMVEDMDADVIDFMFCEMQKADCGVEMNFEVVCAECGSESTHSLPFDLTFFFPKAGAQMLSRRN